MVSLAAGLGGEGQSDLLTAGLSDDGLDLVHGVGGVNKLGHVEARVLDLVLALDFGDLNGLGHTDFLGSWVRKRAGDLEGSGDQGHLVGLGLVLLVAHLVLSGGGVAVVAIAVSSSSTGGHLHGLGLVLVGDLGGGAGGGDILLLVHVGADLPVHGGGGELAHGQHSVEAVVLVSHLLDGQLHGGDLVREGGDTHLRVHAGVRVAAVELRGVAVGGGVVGGGSGGSADKGEEKLQN